MEKKHLALGALVVVVIIGVLVFPSARFGLFTLKARGPIEALGRTPTTEQILQLPAELQQVAARHHMDPAKLKVKLAVEERSMMGTGVLFTYLLVSVTEGSRSWTYTVGSEKGHRIGYESSLGPDFLRALEEGGVEVSRPGAQ